MAHAARQVRSRRQVFCQQYSTTDYWNNEGMSLCSAQKSHPLMFHYSACLQPFQLLGIEPVIPSKENENRDSRSVVFDREVYRERNIIERRIGWLKECRRIFSRFEKTAKNFGGMIKIAFIQRYLRLLA